MQEFYPFVHKLQTDIEGFVTAPREQWVELATRYVNGMAAEELRRLVSVDTRRASGAFFTNAGLARKILAHYQPTFGPNSVVYDPACGAGNLLIAVADYLLEQGIVIDTQKHVLGTDQHASFVQATGLRLQTHALLHELQQTNREGNAAFFVECKDGLQNNHFYQIATHIFVNPPFNQIDSNDELTWAKGKVSAAAIFIDKILSFVRPGTTIIAILPDVLRSGTRYQKWRTSVEARAEVGDIFLLGQFDEHADVDVYAVELTKKDVVKKSRRKLNKLDKGRSTAQTLDDLFDICVGPVVDNRDPHNGPWAPYVVSRGLAGWSVQRDIERRRRHEGKAFTGPFVVVKRTSRMSDVDRAISTIIHVPRPVYVDNHLIILRPKSQLVRDCQLALRILKDPRTNNWLNQQIRCRHLTVGVIQKPSYLANSYLNTIVVFD